MIEKLKGFCTYDHFVGKINEIVDVLNNDETELLKTAIAKTETDDLGVEI